jgi:hypothetical protein
MKSRFHAAADAEISEAVAYYDAKAPGLGDRLLADIKAATRYIEHYPDIAPVSDEDVRAKVLVRFPYSLMYVVETDELYIVAVAHHSRRPGYWADRLPAGG